MTERDRETETQRERQTDRQRQRETETHRERDIDRETDSDRQTQIHRETHGETHTETETDRDRENECVRMSLIFKQCFTKTFEFKRAWSISLSLYAYITFVCLVTFLCCNGYVLMELSASVNLFFFFFHTICYGLLFVLFIWLFLLALSRKSPCPTVG